MDPTLMRRTSSLAGRSSKATLYALFVWLSTFLRWMMQFLIFLARILAGFWPILLAYKHKNRQMIFGRLTLGFFALKVSLMSGPGSGKQGKVLRVIRRKNMVLVDGVNIVRHRFSFFPLKRDLMNDFLTTLNVKCFFL